MASEQSEPLVSQVAGRSPMSKLVAEAWDATNVVAEQVDQATREAAFRLILEALLRNGEPSAPPASTHESAGTTSAQNDDALDTGYATSDQRAYAIADYLNISYDDALDLYDVDSAEPVLHVRSSRLSDGRAAATREIALLVAAGRAALGLDTGSQHVRDAVEEHRKLDPANFGSTLNKMDQISLRGKTRSQNRLVRLRAIGVEAVRELAVRIVGE